MLRNMAGIYIIDKDRILLLYRMGSRVVPPSWCNIGGHFEFNELNDPEACMLRELYEETGITQKDLANITLRYITLRNKENEIRQNYYFFADLINKELQLRDCDEGILEWVQLDKALEREMPYTANGVLCHYLSVGKQDNKIYAGIAMKDQLVIHALSDF